MANWLTNLVTAITSPPVQPPSLLELTTAARQGQTKLIQSWLDQTVIGPEELYQTMIWALEWDHKVALETILQFSSLAGYYDCRAIGLAVELGNTRLLPVLVANFTGRVERLRKIQQDYNLKAIALDPAFTSAAREQAKTCYNIIMGRMRQLYQLHQAELVEI